MFYSITGRFVLKLTWHGNRVVRYLESSSPASPKWNTHDNKADASVFTRNIARLFLKYWFLAHPGVKNHIRKIEIEAV